MAFAADFASLRLSARNVFSIAALIFSGWNCSNLPSRLRTCVIFTILFQGSVGDVVI